MMDEAAAKGYIRGYETLVDWEAGRRQSGGGCHRAARDPPQGPRL